MVHQELEQMEENLIDQNYMELLKEIKNTERLIDWIFIHYLLLFMNCMDFILLNISQQIFFC